MKVVIRAETVSKPEFIGTTNEASTTVNEVIRKVIDAVGLALARKYLNCKWSSKR
jgi:hypothetical protein